MNFKSYIAQKLNINEEAIQIPPNSDMGDFCFPCFSLAKEQKKSPFIIAGELQKILENDQYIEKSQIVGGYLNIFLNKQIVSKILFEEAKNLNIEQIGQNKVVCIDYCSVNLAKYMHIGHFATTIIGESLARIYEMFGYKVIRINYVGDFGTPFGKMVVAYKLWGDKEVIQKKGIEAVQDLYVKFNKEENEDLLEKARNASKNIEDAIGEDYEIYKFIINVTIEETKRLVGRMEIKFDDWRGESTYNHKMDKPIDELMTAGLLKDGEGGAKIVDLNQYGYGVSVIVRADGATLYVTRDLAAVEDRFQIYNFDEMIYVTAQQQDNHFAKLFKLCELLNKPYAKKLTHASYGMFSLPEGKIASRMGKQALFEDILNEAENMANLAVASRNISKDQKSSIAKNVAMGAIAYSVLKVEKAKDKVFDMEKAISFDGETGPYLQYTCARLCSLIKNYQNKYGNIQQVIPNINGISFNLIKEVANIKNIILLAKEKHEPSIIAKKLMEIAKLFNKFYNETKIVTDDKNQSLNNINIILVLKKMFEKILPLVCVTPIEEM